MIARAVLYGLLFIVATSAAVLSFSALRDLALLCGFAPELAWLLPVVVDAGAAAGSLVWLARPAAEPHQGAGRSSGLRVLARRIRPGKPSHHIGRQGRAIRRARSGRFSKLK